MHTRDDRAWRGASRGGPDPSLPERDYTTLLSLLTPKDSVEEQMLNHVNFAQCCTTSTMMSGHDVLSDEGMTRTSDPTWKTTDMFAHEVVSAKNATRCLTRTSEVRVSVVGNSRLSPYTPQSVAASLAAVKRAEHAALNQFQNTLEHAQRIPKPTQVSGILSRHAESRHTHTHTHTSRTRPTLKGKVQLPTTLPPRSNVRSNRSSFPCMHFLPPASPWIMQAVPSYTDTWAGLIRSCEVHAVNPHR